MNACGEYGYYRYVSKTGSESGTFGGTDGPHHIRSRLKHLIQTYGMNRVVMEFCLSGKASLRRGGGGKYRTSSDEHADTINKLLITHFEKDSGCCVNKQYKKSGEFMQLIEQDDYIDVKMCSIKTEDVKQSFISRIFSSPQLDVDTKLFHGLVSLNRVEELLNRVEELLDIIDK